MKQIYYVADTHFSHRAIAELRSFETVQGHDEALIESWNRFVRPEDDIYILGDLFGYKFNGKVLERLSGIKHLICGNHEKIWLKHADVSGVFTEIVDDHLELDDNGTRVVLCHYPREELCPSPGDGYLLYGHVHIFPRSPEYRRVCARPNALNVGVDISRFAFHEFAPAVLENWKFINAVWKKDGGGQFL